jgi:mono/diheme cytochrome c family protein
MSSTAQPDRSGFVRLAACAAVALLAGVGLGYLLFHKPPPPPKVPDDRWALTPQAKDSLGDGVTKVVYLSQNWTPQQSVEFYSLSQGSRLVPYSWFLALEQPDNQKPFRDPDHIRQLRYLPQQANPYNPDGLPIGFVKEGKDDWLGLNCAACHTNQINYNGTGIRIDGAPGMGDAEGLLNRLGQALHNTREQKEKFDRFAKAVLQDPNDADGQAALKAQMDGLIKVRDDYNARNDRGNDPASPTHPPYGYARIDAFGTILNQVLALGLGVPANAKISDAPVSYPCLWDTPQHKLVQWNGVAENFTVAGKFKAGALARNVGEVLGVFGEIDLKPGQFPPGYDSSVRLFDLMNAENSLTELWSPKWPEDILPRIDTAKAEQGKALFQKFCVDCHKVIVRDDPARTAGEKMVALGDIKTDDKMALNFTNRRADTGILKGSRQGFSPLSQDKWGAEAAGVDLLKDAASGAIVHGLLSHPVDSVKAVARAALAADATDPLKRYKARPLNGVWATAPYLHNGSVPTLYQLLLPPAERVKTFYVGRLEFDPKEVGFLYRDKVDGAFEFDTMKDGNHNSGHEYGTNLKDLNDDQRWQIVEYLKTL